MKALRFKPLYSWLALGMLASSTHAQFFAPSAERDIELRGQVASQVERQFGLYSQPQVESYLRTLGEKLAAAANDSRWKFTFQIVDQKEPNAFAIPGGGIYVSRGLLALVTREDELAGALAHEIAHVTQQHSARQQRKGFLPGLLSLPGNLVGAVVSDDLGNIINAPIDTVGGAWLSHYSRGQESESDRIGMRTAGQCGYDPAALGDLLVRIDKSMATHSDKEREFSIFDSHPMTETRLKDIRSRATSVAVGSKAPIAANTAALFAQLDGMWLAENPEQGILRKDQFLQPDIGFAINLPAGWKHQNTQQQLMSLHPEKEAMLLLTVAGAQTDPETLGKKFVEKMRAKARIEPDSTRKSSIGSFPAYVVSYLDRSKRSPVYLHFAWVAMAGKTYQLVGLAPEKYRETLRDSALTLRPITATERASVTAKRLRVATAVKDERLEDLAARTGNVWSPAYTALVNGLNAETPLTEGQLVKIAREEPYQTSK